MNSREHEPAVKTNPPTWQRFVRAGVLPRLVVILLGVPCLYLITARGGFFFMALTSLIIFLGLREFYVLVKAKIGRAHV